MGRDIPPLNPLRVFESVARLRSFSKAADSLHVSQSAISRQVSLLEEYLGVQFFHRDRSGIRLTAAGETYFREIGPAFERIAEATRNLARQRDGEPLRLRVYSTFAAKWLLPRLANFQEHHPDIRLRIVTAVAPVDFTKDEADASIQFGAGDWTDVESVLLCHGELRPVCAPKLLNGLAAPLQAQDLARFRLIHSHYRKNDWPEWFASAGIDMPEQGDPFMLPNSLLAYQAAVDGLGVALAQMRMIEPELASGALTYFCKHSMTTRYAYYFVSPLKSAHADKLKCLFEWLVEQIGDESLNARYDEK